MKRIDTTDHQSLYGRKDIEKYGRYRPLPDIEFRPAVKEEMEKIENGNARMPREDRLISEPMFRDREDNEEEKDVFCDGAK